MLAAVFNVNHHRVGNIPDLLNLLAQAVSLDNFNTDSEASYKQLLAALKRDTRPGSDNVLGQLNESALNTIATVLFQHRNNTESACEALNDLDSFWYIFLPANLLGTEELFLALVLLVNVDPYSVATIPDLLALFAEATELDTFDKDAKESFVALFTRLSGVSATRDLLRKANEAERGRLAQTLFMYRDNPLEAPGACNDPDYSPATSPHHSRQNSRRFGIFGDGHLLADLQAEKEAEDAAEQTHRFRQ